MQIKFRNVNTADYLFFRGTVHCTLYTTEHTYLFIGFVIVSLFAMLILLNCCSSIAGWPVALVWIVAVPLFTLAALCDGIKLIFTMSLALENSTHILLIKISKNKRCNIDTEAIEFHVSCGALT